MKTTHIDWSHAEKKFQEFAERNKRNVERLDALEDKYHADNICSE